MTQYINKAAAMAEIEKRKKEAESNCGGYKSHDEHRCDACMVDLCKEFLEILNTIETKEADFDEEFRKYHIGVYNPFNSGAEIYEFAKHFYELGLNAQKVE